MKAIASLGYVGFLRPAPGTWGSAVSVVLAYGVLLVGGFWLLAALTVVAFVVGWYATAQVTKTGDHDPSWVVIDELVGQWIALWPVGYGAAFAGADLLALYPGWIAAFVLFRLFDIRKPWLVGKADRRGDAYGVMMDDVWAGVFAAFGVFVLAALYHVPLILNAQ
ncbi:phosphatidylglycerophosphatase A [Tropicibacter naphthalenivorans]|uniref:Phosphatidylglycerophosphatase A n=1 Tax=Tropicibacter naphthalenivorans TaxID=441103 RepID=A0A0P1GNS1_9RHOB|nr:phosphatidylglycerophosphatase A [Tropicibacter naphthalenivorans]CUH76935.1 Phosphatidylglycerophosphatase A [Tropicibacter naphthalenivorans]SMC62148.1 phosphatidylglycerophosphatase A [Tropicibacter naphthalenivorans]